MREDLIDGGGEEDILFVELLSADGFEDVIGGVFGVLGESAFLEPAFEGLDDVSVELFSGPVAEDADDFVVLFGGAIGLLGAEGIVGIDDGEDSGAEGDLAAELLEGVGDAVDEGLSMPEEIEDSRVDVAGLEDAESDVVIEVDQVGFGVLEFSGLIEDVVGDADFSDIVEEGGDFECAELSRIPGKLFSDPLGEDGNAPGMANDILIAVLECGEQASQDIGGDGEVSAKGDGGGEAFGKAHQPEENPR